MSDAPLTHLVQRPRIVQLLLDRFERRVTMVTAPAGAGKTSALSLAVANNLLVEPGIDTQRSIERWSA